MTKPTNMTPPQDVKEQIDSGVPLADLKLPPMPKNQVTDWESVNPLTIYKHESLSEYVFRWLNPKQRERGSMEGWQYVTGDLAIAVRRCGIIPALVGGDSSDEMLRNGDLILGWMPAAWMDKRKAHMAKVNAQVRESVEGQEVAAETMKSGRGSRYINRMGSVEAHRGSISED